MKTKNTFVTVLINRIQLNIIFKFIILKIHVVTYGNDGNTFTSSHSFIYNLITTRVLDTMARVQVASIARVQVASKINKPPWVSPVMNPRRPRWSPSMQSYPPLIATIRPRIHRNRSEGQAGSRISQLNHLWNRSILLSRTFGLCREGAPPFTSASGVRRDVRKMRPAGQKEAGSW